MFSVLLWERVVSRLISRLKVRNQNWVNVAAVKWKVGAAAVSLSLCPPPSSCPVFIRQTHLQHLVLLQSNTQTHTHTDSLKCAPPALYGTVKSSELNETTPSRLSGKSPNRMKAVLVSLSLSFCAATSLTRIVSKRNLLMNTPVLTDVIQRHAERVTTVAREATFMLLCYDGLFFCRGQRQ